MMVLLQNVSAQTGIDKKKIEYHPRSFIGIGHGINSYTGMTGLSLEFPFDDRISMFFSGGLGTWGYKTGGGFGLYLLKTTKGPSLSVGYARAFGLKNYMFTLQTISGEYEQVSMVLKPAATLQLMFNYNIKVIKCSKMVIGTGYAVQLNKNAYEIKSLHVLGDNGKRMMKFLQPGGLIMSFTFMFGLR